MGIRELQDVDIDDISIVTNPAYPAADVAMRSLDKYRETLQQVREADTAIDVLRARLDLLVRE